jgi:hypothetical protein
MPTQSVPRDDSRRSEQAAPPGASQSAWRQPVVWLAATIFIASIIGCVVIILLASGQDESPAGSATDYLMKVPINRVVVDPSAPSK